MSDTPRKIRNIDSALTPAQAIGWALQAHHLPDGTVYGVLQQAERALDLLADNGYYVKRATPEELDCEGSFACMALQHESDCLAGIIALEVEKLGVKKS